MSEHPDVLVIGGGTIGVCCAYYAAKAGMRVTLLEKGKLASGCSYGNAGHIVPSHSVPLAAPGVMTQGLKWMLDPESPLVYQAAARSGTRSLALALSGRRP